MKPMGLILGIGNQTRGDDRAGLEVARRLRAKLTLPWDICETDGETANLIDLLSRYRRVIAIDAVVTGEAAPGTVLHWDASEEPLPTVFCRASTHNLGLSEAIELARIFGNLPPSMDVLGIEGSRFDISEMLSPAVEKAVDDLVAKLAEERGNLECMSIL